MTPVGGLSPEEAAYYLRLFRQARYKTLEDAEDFRAVCYVLEEFGCRLGNKHLIGLKKYKDTLKGFVKQGSQNEFDTLFSLVVKARNDASHRGVFARSLAIKAIKAANLLEEKLYTMTTLVRHIMTEDVVAVHPFHTLSKVREMMLENSFSHLPIEKQGVLHFVSDHQIAKLWNDNNLSDNDKYATPLYKLAQLPILVKVTTIGQNEPISSAYQKMQSLPLLVTDDGGNLVGILTPFDLL